MSLCRSLRVQFYRCNTTGGGERLNGAKDAVPYTRVRKFIFRTSSVRFIKALNKFSKGVREGGGAILYAVDRLTTGNRELVWATHIVETRT